MSSVVSNTTPNGPLVDKDGRALRGFLKWMQGVGQTVNGGFDENGNYQGPIGVNATIAGRRTLATIVQHLSTAGVIDADGLPAATPTEQGAVYMPAGAVDNHLGSAATYSSADFDYAGAASAAQTAAESYAYGVSETAESNAEAHSDAALAAAFAPGITIVITTAKLTVGGTNGSMSFQSGLLTAQVAAT